MAKALVILINGTNPNPDIDVQALPKRGDVMSVQPDDFDGWGNKEKDPSLFQLVDVPDSWLTDANKYDDNLAANRAQRLPFSMRRNVRLARLKERARKSGFDFTAPKIRRLRRWAIDVDDANRVIDRNKEQYRGLWN